jgi:very-short-patch-repair endonuclease
MSKKVAIETDGETWHSSKKARKKDGFKNYMLKRQGWTVLRFTGKEVENDMDSVIKKIRETLSSV